MNYFDTNHSCGCSQGRTNNNIKYVQETNCYYPEEWNDEKEYANDNMNFENTQDRCDWPRKDFKERESFDREKNCGHEKEYRCPCKEDREEKKDCANRHCHRCCLCNLFRNCRRW